MRGGGKVRRGVAQATERTAYLPYRTLRFDRAYARTGSTALSATGLLAPVGGSNTAPHDEEPV
jgi:hypothetical protein